MNTRGLHNYREDSGKLPNWTEELSNKWRKRIIISKFKIVYVND